MSLRRGVWMVLLGAMLSFLSGSARWSEAACDFRKFALPSKRLLDRGLLRTLAFFEGSQASLDIGRVQSAFWDALMSDPPDVRDDVISLNAPWYSILHPH